MAGPFRLLCGLLSLAAALLCFFDHAHAQTIVKGYVATTPINNVVYPLFASSACEFKYRSNFASDNNELVVTLRGFPGVTTFPYKGHEFLVFQFKDGLTPFTGAYAPSGSGKLVAGSGSATDITLQESEGALVVPVPFAALRTAILEAGNEDDAQITLTLSGLNFPGRTVDMPDPPGTVTEFISLSLSTQATTPFTFPDSTVLALNRYCTLRSELVPRSEAPMTAHVTQADTGTNAAKLVLSVVTNELTLPPLTTFKITALDDASVGMVDFNSCALSELGKPIDEVTAAAPTELALEFVADGSVRLPANAGWKTLEQHVPWVIHCSTVVSGLLPAHAGVHLTGLVLDIVPPGETMPGLSLTSGETPAAASLETLSSTYAQAGGGQSATYIGSLKDDFSDVTQVKATVKGLFAEGSTPIAHECVVAVTNGVTTSYVTMTIDSATTADGTVATAAMAPALTAVLQTHGSVFVVTCTGPSDGASNPTMLIEVLFKAGTAGGVDTHIATAVRVLTNQQAPGPVVPGEVPGFAITQFNKISTAQTTFLTYIIPHVVVETNNPLLVHFSNEMLGSFKDGAPAEPPGSIRLLGDATDAALPDATISGTDCQVAYTTATRLHWAGAAIVTLVTQAPAALWVGSDRVAPSRFPVKVTVMAQLQDYSLRVVTTTAVSTGASFHYESVVAFSDRVNSLTRREVFLRIASPRSLQLVTTKLTNPKVFDVTGMSTELFASEPALRFSATCMVNAAVLVDSAAADGALEVLSEFLSGATLCPLVILRVRVETATNGELLVWRNHLMELSSLSLHSVSTQASAGSTRYNSAELSTAVIMPTDEFSPSETTLSLRVAHVPSTVQSFYTLFPVDSQISSCSVVIYTDSTTGTTFSVDAEEPEMITDRGFKAYVISVNNGAISDERFISLHVTCVVSIGSPFFAPLRITITQDTAAGSLTPDIFPTLPPLLPVSLVWRSDIDYDGISETTPLVNPHFAINRAATRFGFFAGMPAPTADGNDPHDWSVDVVKEACALYPNLEYEVSFQLPNPTTEEGKLVTFASSISPVTNGLYANAGAVDCTSFVWVGAGSLSSMATSINGEGSLTLTHKFMDTGESKGTSEVFYHTNNGCPAAKAPAVATYTSSGDSIAPVLAARHDAVATVSCPEFYSPTGTSTLTCNNDNTWDGGSMPTCVVTVCPDLGMRGAGWKDPATYDNQERAVGTIATVTCVDGKAPSHEFLINPLTCQADGQWSWTNAAIDSESCLSTCADPTDANGDFTFSYKAQALQPGPLAEGAVSTLVCTDPYVVRGTNPASATREATCTATGWDETLACGRSCPDVPFVDDENTQVKDAPAGGLFYMGESATVECSPDYYANPRSVTRGCVEDDVDATKTKWDSAVPLACVPVCNGELLIGNKKHVITESDPYLAGPNPFTVTCDSDTRSISAVSSESYTCDVGPPPSWSAAPPQVLDCRGRCIASELVIGKAVFTAIGETFIGSPPALLLDCDYGYAPNPILDDEPIICVDDSNGGSMWNRTKDWVEDNACLYACPAGFSDPSVGTLTYTRDGTTVSSPYLYDTDATIECPTGYTPSAKSVCTLDVGWVPSAAPSCARTSCLVSQLTTGPGGTWAGSPSWTGETAAVATVATLTCEQNFGLVDGTSTTTCAEDYAWGTPMPACVPVCLIADLLVSASLKVSAGEKTQYEVDDKVTISCADNYASTDSDVTSVEIECTAASSASWLPSQVAITCEPSCAKSQLTDGTGYVVTYAGRTFVGDEASIDCSEPRRLNPVLETTPVTCNAGTPSTWQYTDAWLQDNACLVACPTLAGPEATFAYALDGQPATAVGDTLVRDTVATITCSGGYAPAGGITQATCTDSASTGTWSESLECVLDTCAASQLSANGGTWTFELSGSPVSGAYFDPNTVATLTCPTNYRISDSQSSTATTTCSQDFAWSTSPSPECVRLSCPTPQPPEGGVPPEPAERYIDDTLAFTCREGFHTLSATTETQTCGFSGADLTTQWLRPAAAQQIECLAGCYDFTSEAFEQFDIDFSGAVVEANSQQFPLGTTPTVSCFATSAEPPTIPQLTCIDVSGRSVWSSNVPALAADCKKCLFVNVQSRFQGTTTDASGNPVVFEGAASEGSVVTFTCLPGYAVANQPTVKTQSSTCDAGSWTDTFVICDPLSCDERLIDPDSHQEVEDPNYPKDFGGVGLSLKCVDGYANVNGPSSASYLCDIVDTATETLGWVLKSGDSKLDCVVDICASGLANFPNGVASVSGDGKQATFECNEHFEISESVSEATVNCIGGTVPSCVPVPSCDVNALSFPNGAADAVFTGGAEVSSGVWSVGSVLTAFDCGVYVAVPSSASVTSVQHLVTCTRDSGVAEGAAWKTSALSDLGLVCIEPLQFSAPRFAPSGVSASVLFAYDTNAPVPPNPGGFMMTNQFASLSTAAPGATSALGAFAPLATANTATAAICSYVMSAADVEAAGAGATCQWRSPREFVVAFGSNAMASPNIGFAADRVTYSPAGLTQRYSNVVPSVLSFASLGFLGPSSVAVLPPETGMQQPVEVVISAPTRVSACSTFTVSAAGSTGGAGRPLEFQYTIVSPANAVVDPALPIGWVSASSVRMRFVTAVSDTFVVQIEARNRWGAQRTATVSIVSVPTNNVPELAVLGGTLTRAIFANKPLALTGSARAPACAASTVFSTFWRRVGVTGTTPGLSIAVPSFQLPVSTTPYMFEFVAVSAQGAELTKLTVPVLVQSRPLVARISTTPVRTAATSVSSNVELGDPAPWFNPPDAEAAAAAAAASAPLKVLALDTPSKSFQLYANSSRDPNVSPTGSQLSFTWGCYFMRFDTTVSDASWAAEDCPASVSAGLVDDQPIVDVDISEIAPFEATTRSMLVLAVTVVSSAGPPRSSRAVATVEIVQSLGYQVLPSYVPPALGPASADRVSAALPLRLTSTVVARSAAYALLWSCDALDLAAAGVLSSPRTGQHLTLAAGALQPGAVYRFTLTITPTDTAFPPQSASLTLRTSSVPAGGSCEQRPAEDPLSLENPLQAAVLCEAWAVSDESELPLRYRWFLVPTTGSGQPETLLAMTEELPYASLKLAPGTHSIRVEVSNRFGVSAHQTVPAIINDVLKPVLTLQDFVQQASTAAEQHAAWSIVQSATAALVILGSTPPSTETVTASDSLLETLLQFNSTKSLSDAEAADRASTADDIDEIASSSDGSSLTIELVARLLQSSNFTQPQLDDSLITMRSQLDLLVGTYVPVAGGTLSAAASIVSFNIAGRAASQAAEPNGFVAPGSTFATQKVVEQSAADTVAQVGDVITGAALFGALADEDPVVVRGGSLSYVAARVSTTGDESREFGVPAAASPGGYYFPGAGAPALSLAAGDAVLVSDVNARYRHVLSSYGLTAPTGSYQLFRVPGALLNSLGASRGGELDVSVVALADSASIAGDPLVDNDSQPDYNNNNATLTGVFGGVAGLTLLDSSGVKVPVAIDVEVPLANGTAPAVLDPAAEAALIRIVIPHERATPTNYTSVCQFLKESTQSWSTEGCTVLEVTAAHTVCACNHLTMFSVRFSPRFFQPHFIDFDLDSFRDLSWHQISQNPIPLIMLCVWVALTAVLLVIAGYVDRKMDRKGITKILEQWHPSTQVYFTKAEEYGVRENASMMAFLGRRFFFVSRRDHPWLAWVIRPSTDNFGSQSRMATTMITILITLTIAATFFGAQEKEATITIAVITTLITFPINRIFQVVFDLADQNRLKRWIYFYAEHVAFLHVTGYSEFFTSAECAKVRALPALDIDAVRDIVPELCKWPETSSEYKRRLQYAALAERRTGTAAAKTAKGQADESGTSAGVTPQPVVSADGIAVLTPAGATLPDGRLLRVPNPYTTHRGMSRDKTSIHVVLRSTLQLDIDHVVERYESRPASLRFPRGLRLIGVIFVVLVAIACIILVLVLGMQIDRSHGIATVREWMYSTLASILLDAVFTGPALTFIRSTLVFYAKYFFFGSFCRRRSKRYECMPKLSSSRRLSVTAANTSYLEVLGLKRDPKLDFEKDLALESTDLAAPDASRSLSLTSAATTVCRVDSDMPKSRPDGPSAGPSFDFYSPMAASTVPRSLPDPSADTFVMSPTSVPLASISDDDEPVSPGSFQVHLAPEPEQAMSADHFP